MSLEQFVDARIDNATGNVFNHYNIPIGRVTSDGRLEDASYQTLGRIAPDLRVMDGYRDTGLRIERW